MHPVEFQNCFTLPCGSFILFKQYLLPLIHTFPNQYFKYVKAYYFLLGLQLKRDYLQETILK